MRRPARSEASAVKGRPKRRAAKTHFFKYQLAGNSSRAEEQELKRALQESLEEQHYQPPNRRKITSSINNSSTNSSDVSRSNNSCSSNESAGPSLTSSTPKRTRSNTSSLQNGTANKRARLDVVIEHNQSKCDVRSKAPVESPAVVPHINRPIKTYSRSQPNPVNIQKNQEQLTNGSKPSLSPNTSHSTKTKSSSQNLTSKDNPEQRTKASIQHSVSKSTQTKNVSVKNCLTPTSNKDLCDDTKSSLSGAVNDDNSKKPPAIQDRPDQYLKFKRESKNYAYVKMTALKVSTQKMPSSNSKSANSKKNPSNETLVSDCKQPPKVTVKASKGGRASTGEQLGSTRQQIDNISSNTSIKSGGPRHDTSSKKTNVTVDKISSIVGPPTKASLLVNNSSDINRSPVSLHETQSSLLVRIGTSKYDSDVQSDSLESLNDCIEQTIDLSNKKNQNQANIKMTKRRMPQGSWCLLGVPEEKVIYLRDDEPPRRLICYPAIKHEEGDVIQVRDSVLLRSGAKKTDLPYIAKVCAFWEDAETGGVMMSLFWYYRPEHTEEGRKPHHLVDEIFASRHRDVDSVECIEDKSYVLTFNEYCRYRKRCKMEQVNTTWSLTDVTIPVSNESYPRRNRIPDSDVNPELVFCCRQIYDSRSRRLIKNPHINPKYGHI